MYFDNQLSTEERLISIKYLHTKMKSFTESKWWAIKYGISISHKKAWYLNMFDDNCIDLSYQSNKIKFCKSALRMW
jgi:hypothetical protein